jgi:hypothetical protein
VVGGGVRTVVIAAVIEVEAKPKDPGLDVDQHHAPKCYCREWL